MGVQGLWKLLESTGRPVSLESLEGKVLTIDVSLWLHQAMRGMRDDGGNVAANAHLHVLFNRICKLLFYRIKPIFVFDGSVPELKRQTMVARRQRREIAAGKSKRTSEKIIKNYLQSHALHAVIGEAGGSQENAGPKLKTIPAEPDMYQLPPVPPAIMEDSESDSNEETDLRADHLGRYQRLEDIDIESEGFHALPPEIQHEIMMEMKETRKRNSWKTIDQLPKKSADFSDYQMKRLLLKGKMTKRIDVLRKEMTERNAGAIASMLDMEGGRTHAVEAGRIMSEDSHHYLLVKRHSSKTEGDKTEEPTDEESSVKNKDAAPSTSWQSSETNIETDRRGQSSDDAKVQSSSQMPWESDVIVIDDTEPDLDSSRAAEIAQIVKKFFQDKMSSTGSVSPKKKSANQGTKSEEAEVIEIIQEGSQDKDGTSFVESRMELREDAEVIILDQDDHETESSAPHPVEMVERGLSKEPSQSSSPDVIALDEDSNEEHTALVDREQSIQDVAAGARMVEEGKEVVAKGIKDLSDESSGDDDFVEVVEQPENRIQEEELFPASAFIPFGSVREKATLVSSTSTTADINPQASSEPRVAEASAPMETKALATETDEERNAQDDEEEVDDADDYEEVRGEEDGEMESLREATRKEWEAMNVDDVPQLQENLEAERQVLQTERGKQDRMATSITDLMYAESKELLELFGVPYVVSPEEAEAQCAFLDMTEQTQGTITDDSDVWLFGGRTIYKNFFSRGKDVECFKSVDIENQLVLDRSKLITLAMLLGSDYTDGVKGIGWVTAMEVLTQFPGEGVDLLKALKSWWDVAHKQLMPPVESQLKGQLRKLTMPSSFPCQQVFDAYGSPNVDDSTEAFSWQSPDLGLLRDFAKVKLGWTRAKADETLLPVMKKVNETVTQSRITTFFQAEREEPRKVTSKRLKQVLRRLHNLQAPEPVEEEKRKVGTKQRSGRKSKEAVALEMKSKKRKKGRRGKDGVDLDAEEKNMDKMSVETGEDPHKEDGRIKRNSSGVARTVSGDVEDTDSSCEEYDVPKKIKIQIYAADSPSSSLRRSQRTNEKEVDYAEDEEPSLAEFVEIEQAMSQKTEGLVSKTTAKGQSANGAHDQRVDGNLETDNLKISMQRGCPLQGTMEQTELKNELLGLRKGQVKRGKGQSLKGQRERGKGHAGLKGKGKATGVRGTAALERRGPKLSESSSSDSDE